ncbi:uncharacterized protein CLUP02_07673 [Colletotrichum lupini]|uniref:Uncharacterized protein n=1 Tax=Colletotrichum lupini TaxID=145971 RepID=A0A9Q8STA5_9PEZI|nr:uncharacterized protein CLUP02_07673 [Colletotrichum lupini]UQC82187.1 hypothetical protein CLUP02_07673 [Colletotrichum lupini]
MTPTTKLVIPSDSTPLSIIIVLQELAASAHWYQYETWIIPFAIVFFIEVTHQVSTVRAIKVVRPKRNFAGFILKRNSLSRLSCLPATSNIQVFHQRNAWRWTKTATTTAVHKARENVHVQSCGLLPKLPYRCKTEMSSVPSATSPGHQKRRISYDNHDRLRFAFSLNHVYEFKDGFWASAVSERIVFTLKSKEMGHLREHVARTVGLQTGSLALAPKDRFESRDWYQDRAQAPSWMKAAICAGSRTTYMRQMSLAVLQHACASSYLLLPFSHWHRKASHVSGSLRSPDQLLENVDVGCQPPREKRSNVRTQPILSLSASGTLGAAASQRCYRSGQASCNVESSKFQKGVTSCSHLSETFRVQRFPKSHSILTRHRAGVAWRSFTLRLRQQVFANPPNSVPTPGFWVLSSDESKLTCRVRLKLSGRRVLAMAYGLMHSPDRTLVNDSFPVSLEGYKPNGWDSFSSPLDEVATSCCGITQGKNPMMGVSVIWNPVDLPRRASWAARYESISPSLHDSKEYDAPNTTSKWLVLRRLVLIGKGAVRSDSTQRSRLRSDGCCIRNMKTNSSL